jgi:hypothetical protein
VQFLHLGEVGLAPSIYFVVVSHNPAPWAERQQAEDLPLNLYIALWLDMAHGLAEKNRMSASNSLE